VTRPIFFPQIHYAKLVLIMYHGQYMLFWTDTWIWLHE